jgi:peptidoglycan hydrolase CwlO-like protein
MKMAKNYTTFIKEYDERKIQKEIDAADERIKKMMADIEKRNKKIAELQADIERIKGLSGDELKKEYDKRMKRKKGRRK